MSTRVYQSGKYHCTIDLLFDWFGICCVTTDNFCFYLQNRLLQCSQTGGQQYSDTSPLVFTVSTYTISKKNQAGYQCQYYMTKSCQEDYGLDNSNPYIQQQKQASLWTCQCITALQAMLDISSVYLRFTEPPYLLTSIKGKCCTHCTIAAALSLKL